MTQIKIKPVNVLGSDYDQLIIRSININPLSIGNKTGRADVRVSIRSSKYPYLEGRQRVTISGEDYENWGLDDTVFLDKIAEQVGVEIDWEAIEYKKSEHEDKDESNEEPDDDSNKNEEE